VAELTAPVEDGGAGLSTRQAAEVLGVSHPTVVTDKRSGQDLPEESQPHEEEEALAGQDLPLVLGVPDPSPEPTPKEQAAKETKTRRDVSRSASILPDAMAEAICAIHRDPVPGSRVLSRRGGLHS
jgi:hypothetical protein